MATLLNASRSALLAIRRFALALARRATLSPSPELLRKAKAHPEQGALLLRRQTLARRCAAWLFLLGASLTAIAVFKPLPPLVLLAPLLAIMARAEISRRGQSASAQFASALFKQATMGLDPAHNELLGRQLALHEKEELARASPNHGHAEPRSVARL